MGIGCFNVMGSEAGSIKGWAEYLPHAHIWAADIDPSCLYQTDRVTTYTTDTRNIPQFQNDFVRLGVTFDVVIDDGSHLLADQLTFVDTLAPWVKSVMVVEDVDLAHIDVVFARVQEKLPTWKCFIARFPHPKGYRHADPTIMSKNNLVVALNLACPLP